MGYRNGKRGRCYTGPGIGPAGRAVLNWGANTYSIKYRDPCAPDAYKQQGIGRITALPAQYCDEETFIAAFDVIYEGVALEQGDGYISENLFNMDDEGNGYLIADNNGDAFELDEQTGQLVAVRC